MTEREFAIDVVRRLQAAGFRALFAGGCVRDELLGRAPADYDVATDARPEQVKQLFRRRIEVGASFGVIEVLGPKDDAGEWLKVQVATFRSDGTYSDGRRPDTVTFSSPEEDAARRDFTINGLFADPLTGELFDYVGGRADLTAKVLRAIGDPEARFAEDKLRILRAVRMATRFDLAVDPATLVAAKRMAPQIRAVSAERIAEELRKMLAHPARAEAASLLESFGLAREILPEASGAFLAKLPVEASFPLALATMLLANPPKAVRGVCLRLKLSNDELQRIVWLVERRAALDGAPTQPRSILFPLLVQPGIRDLIALHRAQARSEVDALACERILFEVPAHELDPPPLVTGDDLTAAGHKPGPAFKRALDAARAAQFDGKISSRSEALALAERLLRP